MTDLSKYKDIVYNISVFLLSHLLTASNLKYAGL